MGQEKANPAAVYGQNEAHLRQARSNWIKNEAISLVSVDKIRPKASLFGTPATLKARNYAQGKGASFLDGILPVKCGADQRASRPLNETKSLVPARYQ